MEKLQQTLAFLIRQMQVTLGQVPVGDTVTKLLSGDAVRKAVADSVPSSFRELNLMAFEKGYEYGLNARAGAPPELEEVGYAQE